MKAVSESEMLHRMAAWCSSAERCISDVEAKIASAGLEEAAGRRIIDRLLKEKFIDEERFVRSFVNDKLRFNKWGRIKIAYELKRKNISPPLLSEALEAIDESTYQTILTDLLKAKKKVTKGNDERAIFNKLLRFAAGRGFESQKAIPCLRQLFNGNDYEIDTSDEEAFE